MLPGYNTDVQHDGKTYHVQTEDNGESNPTIVTLVYQGGAILNRRKSDYRHLLGVPDYREEVRSLMREQHRQTIKALTEGTLDAAATPTPSPPPPEPASLDEAILRFLDQSEQQGS
jgi:hypothetical protein